MPHTTRELTELILHAPTQDSGWNGAAAMLAQAFDSESAAISMIDTCTAAGVKLSATANYSDSLVRQYENYYFAKDLLVNNFPWNAPGSIRLCADLVDPSHLHASEFYNDWMRRLGIADVMGTVINLGDGFKGVVGVHRARHRSPFDQAIQSKLLALIPKLGSAMSLTHLIAKRHRAAAIDLVFGLGKPAFILDRKLNLLCLNAEAEALVGVCFVVFAQRLSAADRLGDARLQEALQAALREDAFGPRKVAIRSREGGAPVIVAVTTIHSALSSQVFGATLLVTVTNPFRTTLPDIALLQDAFSLTLAEAKVALTLTELRGNAVETARKLGIAHETVRHHLKGLMAKTGCQSQAALIALVTKFSD